MPEVPQAPSASAEDTQRADKKLTQAERRRCPRMNSQVPVTLEWNAEGQTFRHTAKTRIIGRYGCMVVMPEDIGVDQQVRITNLANRVANPAVVVWRGVRRTEGWELGIELINPETDFWGLEW